MSGVTDAKPGASGGKKDPTKSPIVETVELGSMNILQSVIDNANRLGDPFLEDFYSCDLSDGNDFMNEPAHFKPPIQLLDVCEGNISPSKLEFD